MRVKSVVWVALLAIALGSVFAAVGQAAPPANPTGGPDNAPYFSDIFGTPKSCFVPNESVYVSYFDTTNNYNNHVTAIDTMYVSIDSQSTENIAAPAAWASDAVSGTISDGVDVGPVPGDGSSDPQVKAPGGPNAAVLVLVEVGLDSGLFIGNVGTTPVTILGGDMVTVGLTANDQDKAYVRAQLLGWWDSVSTPDPGNAGSYGAGDDIVLKLTAHAANSWANATAGLYYRINGGTWQNGAVWTNVTGTLGGAYPDWYLEITAPGTTVGDTVDVLWQPGTPPPLGCSTTVMLSTTIVDQPVDVADATYTTITVAPDNYSTGFVRDYMTIHAANAAVAGNNWTIGVHGAPAVPAYDYTLDTFPINIGTWNHLTIIGGSQPVVVIDNGTGLGFDIQAGGHFTTIDNLDIRSASATTTRLIQLTNGPTDVTIKNCTLSTVGNAAMGINVGAAGSTRLTIDNNVFTAESGDGAIWFGAGAGTGSNVDPAVTDNTFSVTGVTTTGYAVEGVALVNAVIDNNTIVGYATGIYILASDGSGTAYGATNDVDVTRNTITNGIAAIQVRGPDANGSVTDITIDGNILQNNQYGLRIRDTNATIATANITVLYNLIIGNTTFGISNEDGNLTFLNAELNWWNSTTGPTHAAANADGAGDASSNYVDYRPWLNGQPFAGVGVTLADNTNAAVQGNKTVQSSSWYWTINQALAAVPGCTTGSHCQTVVVDVADGTYAEEIDLSAYANIGTATIRSRDGAAATDVEAGADINIFKTDSVQNLYVGSSAAIGHGFHIYFDTAAVPAPTADKILHLGATLGVYDCTIDGTTGSGIRVDSGSANGTIRGNTITGCQEAGVWLSSVGAGLAVDDNTIEYCGDGIAVDDGGNTLTNNVIRYNTNNGVDLCSNGNQVGGSGNGIYNNTENGLRVNGDGNTVEDNEIHANGLFGVLIETSATGNSFDGNKIYSNGNPGVQLNAASGNVFNTDNSAANTNCIWDNDFNGDYAALPYGQMENKTTTLVDATHNYWGSPDGPFNAMRNPSGDPHSRVSDYIDIASWTLTCGGASADATITLACGAGWYLTSVPLVPADTVAQDVYDELPVFGAYKWNPGTDAYVDLTDKPITWSDGYWLWLMGDETITVEGAAVGGVQDVLFAAAGWQQFGVPSVDIPVEVALLDPVDNPVQPGAPDILFSDDGFTSHSYTYTEAYEAGIILQGFWTYDTCAGKYGKATGGGTVLDPWLGYWFETTVPNVTMRIDVGYWVTHPWSHPVVSTGVRTLGASEVAGRTPPAPPATPRALQAAYDPASGLVVMNEPNPIRDVNTTTFSITSLKSVVDEIRVQIFDQNGAVVFDETQTGNELVWHTQNDYGEYLANGIYLYRVSANIDGRWVVTEVRKLAITR